MQSYRSSMFGNIPPIIKNLLIINVLVFVAKYSFIGFGINLDHYLSLYSFNSSFFKPFQLITHMFMHADPMHIFFNMFALYMFGRILEQVWGGKRLFIYYIICGLGASLLYAGVKYLQFYMLSRGVGMEVVELIQSKEAARIIQNQMNYSDPLLAKLNALTNVPMLGASGAVFGILLAFGMLFPNTQLMLIFPPIPIKAKYFVIIYGAIEVFAVLKPLQGDNVAHLAHLGGMIFGYFLIKYWSSKGIGKYDRF